MAFSDLNSVDGSAEDDFTTTSANSNQNVIRRRRYPNLRHDISSQDRPRRTSIDQYFR